MENLGAKEAADRIRGVFFSDRSQRVDPEQAHQMRFVKEVCGHLGAAHDPETVAHVMTLLREHDIELHAGHEYPKFATRKWDRTSKIVHSEDEERAWVDEAPPEPVDPETLPARTLDAPVQDLSTDLRTKVPHFADDMPDPPKPARIPSAVTNREAAQDAHARQPVETLNREAAADAYTGAAAVDHGEFVDDDEVHVEDIDTLVDTEPKSRSGDSSAGKTDTAKRPVGRRPV